MQTNRTFLKGTASGEQRMPIMCHTHTVTVDSLKLFPRITLTSGWLLRCYTQKKSSLLMALCQSLPLISLGLNMTSSPEGGKALLKKHIPKRTEPLCTKNGFHSVILAVKTDCDVKALKWFCVQCLHLKAFHVLCVIKGNKPNEEAVMTEILETVVDLCLSV